MDIHSKIKATRLKKNFSQSDMAEKMNIALLNYGKIERGVTELSVKRLYEIANILDVSVNELLNDSAQSMDNSKVNELEKRILELEEIVSLQRQLLEEKLLKLEKLYYILDMYIIDFFMRIGNIPTWDKVIIPRDTNGVVMINMSDDELEKFISEKIVTYMIESRDWTFNSVINEWRGDKRLAEIYSRYTGKIFEEREKLFKAKTV